MEGPSYMGIFPLYLRMALILRDFPTLHKIPIYNIVVLFLRQMYQLFIYASKYFLIDHHCQTQTQFSDLLTKIKIYFCSI